MRRCDKVTSRNITTVIRLLSDLLSLVVFFSLLIDPSLRLDYILPSAAVALAQGTLSTNTTDLPVSGVGSAVAVVRRRETVLARLTNSFVLSNRRVNFRVSMSSTRIIGRRINRSSSG